MRSTRSLVDLFLNPLQRAFRFIRDFRPRRRKFLLPLFKRVALFGFRHLRNDVMCRRVQLLLRFRHQPRHLPRELQRSVCGTRRRRERAHVVDAHRRWRQFRLQRGQNLFCRMSGTGFLFQQNHRQLLVDLPFRLRIESEPVFRRKCDAPNVARNLQFQRHLKQLPNRPRPLNPRHSAAYPSRRLPRFLMRYLQLYPHVFQDVVLRLEPATVAVDDQARGPFHEGSAERVDARDHQWNGLHDARAPPFAQLSTGIRHALRDHVRGIRGNIVAKIVHGEIE